MIEIPLVTFDNLFMLTVKLFLRKIILYDFFRTDYLIIFGKFYISIDIKSYSMIRPLQVNLSVPVVDLLETQI